jgi:hypothetical protein
MAAQTWISITKNSEETTLWAHERPFTTGISSDACPSPITLVGRKRKTAILGQALGSHHPTSHGQIRIIVDPSGRHDAPIVYVDCELGSEASATHGHQTAKFYRTRPIGWLQKEHVPNLFISHVLYPLSNVVCYFASDLHGIQGVSKLLAHQALQGKTHTLPLCASAHVLVVMDTNSEVFDPFLAQQRLHKEIIEAMRTSNTNSCNPDDELRSSFHSIQVLGLQKSWDDSTSALAFRRRVSALSREIHWGRRTSRHLFNGIHMDALSDSIITQFCNQKAAFNFIKASRPKYFVRNNLQLHLEELLSLLPSQSWIWQVGIPLIASALFLSSYPPGSHCKSLLY